MKKDLGACLLPQVAIISSVKLITSSNLLTKDEKSKACFERQQRWEVQLFSIRITKKAPFLHLICTNFRHKKTKHRKRFFGLQFVLIPFYPPAPIKIFFRFLVFSLVSGHFFFQIYSFRPLLLGLKQNHCLKMSY